MAGLRMPDFLILGPMKAGTTALFNWLKGHPQCCMPDVKEILFFRYDDRWDKGPEWYGSHFQGIPSECLTGEASNYVDPRFAATAADRMLEAVPDARFIFIIRDRVDRLRSNYRHEVRVGRERRSLPEALEDPSVVYIRRSLYWRGVEPFLERFDESRFCFLDFVELFHHPHTGWTTLLKFLGLDLIEAPATVHNASQGRGGHNRVMRWIRDHDLIGYLNSAPRPLKSLGKQFLYRSDRRYKELMESSKSPIPGAILKVFGEDDARLSAWISERAPARGVEA